VSPSPCSLGAKALRHCLSLSHSLTHGPRGVYGAQGRKIRYEVHDKLVNFMAPVTTPLPPMAEQLISAQLFGQTAMA
jgi:hypothetical protein